MTDKELYRIWAPLGKKWTPWVRPVPFVGIHEHSKEYNFTLFEVPAMDFPEDFDYLEAMADEASAYMTEAVKTYKEVYESENSFSATTEEYARENYSRAYKRLRIITALLRGETPDEEGLTIQ